MNAFMKLGIGALLLGVGFVVSMQAQRELVAKWQQPCEHCEEVEEPSALDLLDIHTEESE